jgi:Tol biopolymer transport system component
VILGTAGYMSPEQVRGQQPDHRSDIFSLGATLYEMVSGERAFKGDTGVEALSAILKHDPPLLSETREAIPASLASVIQHCLEKERDQRFQSARDLAFALSRLAGTSNSGAVILPAGRSRWRRGMLGAAAAAALVAVGGAAYLVRPREASPLPSFQQLTFRRGHIASARFAPDGQTVISTASWDGQPFEVSSMRLDTAESTPLPLPKGTNVRSVSRSGELAVLIKDDVLARVPIGGAGARDVLDRAYDADWAPDGSLAAVRLDGRRMWLEYPPGKTCYEPRNAVNVVRISPDGALLAVVEQQVMGGGAEWLTILDRGCAVVSRSQKFSSVVQDGLAWTPDGREVWFTASQRAGRGEIHAMTRDGRERTVYRGMGSMRIFDFASDGRALIAHDSFRADMSLIEVGVAGERDLSWREWSRPSAISQDGTLLAFGDLGRNSMDGKSHGYVRRTDGSSAVLLSEFGTPSAISPDGKWALTGAPSNPQLALVPTGVGQSRPLDLGTLEATSGLPNGKVWLADGSRIVLVGNERGKRRRVFIQNVAGGPPQPFTPEGAFGPLVTSPDSTHVIVRNEKGHLSKYPIAGGAPVMVEGAEAGDEPLAWSTRGEAIWVLNRGTVPAKIFRIELASGRRAFWREVPYADPAAIEPESLRVVMAADGSRFVYGYQKHLSDLYVVAGLK